MIYELGQANRLGNRRSNQDRFQAIETEEGVLLVLGDGMGGQACGEVAAQILVDTARQHYLDALRPIQRPREFLEKILHQAHGAIIDFGQSQTPPVTPGTTGVLCLVQNGQAVWAHVGDSRLYLYQKGLPLYRTTDHSLVEQLYQMGEISLADLDSHPKRHQITQCLGCRLEAPEVSLSQPIILKNEDVLLLCTDGLWTPLDDAQMGQMLLGRGNLDDIINTMAEQAEQISYPHSDNISVLALRLLANTHQAHNSHSPSQAQSQKGADPLESAIAQIEEVLKEYEKEIKG